MKGNVSIVVRVEGSGYGSYELDLCILRSTNINLTTSSGSSLYSLKIGRMNRLTQLLLLYGFSNERTCNLVESKSSPPEFSRRMQMLINLLNWLTDWNLKDNCIKFLWLPKAYEDEKGNPCQPTRRCFLMFEKCFC